MSRCIDLDETGMNNLKKCADLDKTGMNNPNAWIYMEQTLHNKNKSFKPGYIPLPP